MMNVGPGSYNTNKNVVIFPSYKYNPSSPFATNTQRQN